MRSAYPPNGQQYSPPVTESSKATPLPQEPRISNRRVQPGNSGGAAESHSSVGRICKLFANPAAMPCRSLSELIRRWTEISRGKSRKKTCWRLQKTRDRGEGSAPSFHPKHIERCSQSIYLKLQQDLKMNVCSCTLSSLTEFQLVCK